MVVELGVELRWTCGFLIFFSRILLNQHQGQQAQFVYIRLYSCIIIVLKMLGLLTCRDETSPVLISDDGHISI